MQYRFKQLYGIKINPLLYKAFYNKETIFKKNEKFYWLYPSTDPTSVL
jgi:hypothetical protein